MGEREGEREFVCVPFVEDTQCFDDWTAFGFVDEAVMVRMEPEYAGVYWSEGVIGRSCCARR